MNKFAKYLSLALIFAWCYAQAQRAPNATETLTFKTIDCSLNTCLNVPTSALTGSLSVGIITGTLPVANGGTNAATLTGIVKGNGGTSAFSAAVASDVIGLFSGSADSSHCTSGAGTLVSCAGGGGTSANPSASVGPTAVNGSASTFMTSDSAPPINLAASYTWITGTHTFNGTVAGTGLSTYLASPPAIGGSAAAAGSFTTLASSGVHTTTILPASNTSADGLVLTDTTAAPSTGNQQFSPRIHLTGQGWKTTATAGSETVDEIMELQPVQGSTTPGIHFVFSHSINGGGYVVDSTIDSGGGFTAVGPISAPYVAVSGTTLSAAGIYAPASTTLGLSAGSAQAANFTSTTSTINHAVALPGIASSSAATTGTVCWTTSTGNLTVDTTVACLASTGKVKKNVKPLDVGLPEVMALKPISYDLKDQYNPEHLGTMVGLITEDVQKVDPRLVALDDKGDPRGVRYMQMTAVLVKAIQDQQHEIDDLRKPWR
jgi:hypothetical protein